MLSKIQVLKIFAVLLLFSFAFTGCVEEPTISPVTRPFTAVRIVNLTQNVDAMNIVIDGTPMNQFQDLNGAGVANGIAQQAYTTYFDLQSGQRRFVITNSAGAEVYNNLVELVSYREYVIVFTGEFSTNEDDNSLTAFLFPRGYTFLDDFHQTPTDPQDTTKTNLAADELVVLFAHTITKTISDNRPAVVTNLTLTKTDVPDSTTFDLLDGTPLEEENTAGRVLQAGAYDVSVELREHPDSTASKQVNISESFTGNTDTIFLLGGDYTQPQIVVIKQPNLAARPK